MKKNKSSKKISSHTEKSFESKKTNTTKYAKASSSGLINNSKYAKAIVNSLNRAKFDQDLTQDGPVDKKIKRP